MSHIKNYDVRLLLIVSTLIGMAGLLASLGMAVGDLHATAEGRQGGQVMIIVFAAGALLARLSLSSLGPLVRLRSLPPTGVDCANVAASKFDPESCRADQQALRSCNRTISRSPKFNHTDRRDVHRRSSPAP